MIDIDLYNDIPYVDVVMQCSSSMGCSVSWNVVNFYVYCMSFK